MLTLYGLSPYDVDSHSVTPKLHTSERESNLKKKMHSGAYHLIGHLPAASACKHDKTETDMQQCGLEDQKATVKQQGNVWHALSHPRM